MTLPAAIRVNTLLPFPAQVMGAGPITVAKNNGTWVINFNPAILAQQMPTPPQLFTDFVTVRDGITGVDFRMALSDIVAAVTPVAGALTQRHVTSGPISILSTDRILNLACPAPATVTLPAYALQAGVPLTFKEVGGLATANNITIAAAGGETIDGQASILLDTNYESITLIPANDGVTTGWLEI